MAQRGTGPGGSGQGGSGRGGAGQGGAGQGGAGAERVGLVLSGAAARGPYQAGALAALLPALLADGHRPVVLLGTSSGAITAALLAQYADEQDAAGRLVARTWLEFGTVFTNPLRTLPRGLGRWLARAVLGGGPVAPASGLLDTTPLRRGAQRQFDPARVRANIGRGLVRSLAVAATHCPSGGSAARSRLFVQGAPPERPLRQSAVDVVDTPALQVGHLLASAAIPGLFPPEYVAGPPAGQGWYVDGGVRLNAPVGAALAMGVTRLVVISGHSVGPPPVPHAADAESTPTEPGTPPDIAFTAALALRAVLTDSLGDDLQALGRHNLRLSGTTGEPPPGWPDRVVPYRVVAPQDGQLACLAARAFRPSLVPPDPYLTIGRALDALGEGTGRDELLSMILFDREYARAQIELGARHAAAVLAAPWQVGPPPPPP